MALVTERRCDRCDQRIEPQRSLQIEVKYHHPRTLDFCGTCEGLFTIFLGKHPHSATPLSQILEGRCSGGGYPNHEQIEAYKADQLVLEAARLKVNDDV